MLIPVFNDRIGKYYGSNFSLEANHNKKRSTQEAAYELAERLEIYEPYAE